MLAKYGDVIAGNRDFLSFFLSFFTGYVFILKLFQFQKKHIFISISHTNQRQED